MKIEWTKWRKLFTAACFWIYVAGFSLLIGYLATTKLPGSMFDKRTFLISLIIVLLGHLYVFIFKVKKKGSNIIIKEIDPVVNRDEEPKVIQITKGPRVGWKGVVVLLHFFFLFLIVFNLLVSVKMNNDLESIIYYYLGVLGSFFVIVSSIWFMTKLKTDALLSK